MFFKYPSAGDTLASARYDKLCNVQLFEIDARVRGDAALPSLKVTNCDLILIFNSLYSSFARPVILVLNGGCVLQSNAGCIYVNATL